MKSNQGKLEELQFELKEKLKIGLIIEGGLLAFNSTCLLAIIAIDEHVLITVFAASFFVISTCAFSMIVLAKLHVLHKAGGISITHAISLERHTEKMQKWGMVAFIFGMNILVFQISFYCLIVMMIATIFFGRQFLNFKKDFKSMPDERANTQ